jgi:hypothetical protein
MNKITAPVPSFAALQKISLPKMAAKRAYRAYFFPSQLPWHRIQQFHAVATGHGAAVKLPEARKLSAAAAVLAHDRAVCCLYAHILAAPATAQRDFFDSLLAFLKVKRCPVGLAGPILSALVFYSNTGNKAAQSVCLYLLKTSQFKSDLKSYAKPIPVLSVQKPAIGVTTGGKLLGQLGQVAFQQGVSAQATGSSVLGGSAPSPLGSLNLSFGTDANGAKTMCLIGTAIVGGVVAVGTTVGTDGLSAPAAAGVYGAIYGTGLAICGALFDAPTPAPVASSAVQVPSDAGSKNDDPAPVVGPTPDAGTTPDSGPPPEVDSEPVPEDPDDGGICTPDDPGPSYTTDGGFEAGDWVGNGGGDSGGGLNYGVVPASGDPGADVWAASAGTGALNPSRTGGGNGDPLDVQSYGADTLNYNRLISGAIDPSPIALNLDRSQLNIKNLSATIAAQSASALSLNQVLRSGG